MRGLRNQSSILRARDNPNRRHFQLDENSDPTPVSLRIITPNLPTIEKAPTPQATHEKHRRRPQRPRVSRGPRLGRAPRHIPLQNRARLPRIRSARGGMERTSKSLLERPRSLKGLACEIERRTYPCETVNL